MSGLNEIPPLVSLAPMAGVTDIPFRRQVKAFGGNYCVSEMVASDQLARERIDMVRRAAGAGVIQPLVIQLAGREAHWMAEGARLAEDAGADVIDINMGCPAKSVTSGLCGSALMREPDHALRLIEATVEATRLAGDAEDAAGLGRRQPQRRRHRQGAPKTPAFACSPFMAALAANSFAASRIGPRLREVVERRQHSRDRQRRYRQRSRCTPCA